LNIAGNEKLISQVRNILESGRLWHACIIAGPRGSGKRTFARFLAVAAVCIGKKPPCGKCEGCVKAEKDIHPDIERMRRLPGKKEIVVDQIRSLRASLFTRANEAPRRVAIIEEADLMNENAQNALLKVLEEPPSSVLLVLLSENESELLPTIRSRCVLLRMEPLREEQMIREIKRRYPDIPDRDAKTAANMAGGILGRALENLDIGAGGKIASEIAGAVASGNWEEIITSVLRIEKLKREQIPAELAELKKILAGAAAVKFNRSGYCPTEEERLLAGKMSAGAIVRLGAELEKLMYYCQANVGAGHIAGDLISKLTEECK
jgi:DNA polymerase-3 subunit delta'